jgi:ankyrin repeat protein
MLSVTRCVHLASDKGRLQVQLIKLLIEKGTEVDAWDYKDWTPLHVASCCGPADIVEFLLDKGRDIKAHNDKDWNPLHVVLYEGAVDVVQCLLKQGAHVNAREGSSKTPLHLAKSNKKMKTVQVLLVGGADIYTWDHNDRIPFDEPRMPNADVEKEHTIKYGGMALTQAKCCTLLADILACICKLLGCA